MELQVLEFWFDEVSNQEINPMGSSIPSNNPKFIVKAVGSFKQKPVVKILLWMGYQEKKLIHCVVVVL